jgi:uncharacterized iron-regulated membrane protein
MRNIAILLHRYAGLLLAGFLILTGLTGSLIAFNEELDRLLNPEFYKVSPSGRVLTPSQLIRKVETAYPDVVVGYVNVPKPGESAAVYVRPRPAEGSDKKVKLEFGQFYLDPSTGEVIGKRRSEYRLDRASIMPFIYSFHHTLSMGKTGVFILGIIALIWFFDCFVGMYLAWPRPYWPAIQQAFTVKWRNGFSRLNYDFHRANGLWFWIILLVLAFSSVAMNLTKEVFKPVVSVFSPLSPFVTQTLPKRAVDEKLPLNLSVDQAIERAIGHLAAQGIPATAGAVSINQSKGYYQVRLYTPRNIMKDHAGTRIYVSGDTGEILGSELPNTGTAGDILYDWQFPLHSGRAFGLPGRIIICLTGIAVVVLSITGVIIWWRKQFPKKPNKQSKRHSHRLTT